MTATNAELYARRELQRAVRLDSTLVEAALELARLGLATRERETLDVAIAALTRVGEAAGWSIGVLVALSDVNVAVGNPFAGESYARTAVDVSSCGFAWHSLATALAVQGRDAEAGMAYMRGLDFNDDAFTWLRYFDDVRHLLDGHELQQLDGLSSVFRPHWVRDWWERSAARAGRTVADRISEQIRRYDFAHRAYRRNANRGARPAAFPLSGSSASEDFGNMVKVLSIPTFLDDVPWDEPGLLHVRHGDPDRIITWFPKPPPAIPTRSWIYFREGVAWLFHFMKASDWSDWLLTSGPPCPRPAGISMRSGWLDVVEYEPRYVSLGSACYSQDVTAIAQLHAAIAADQQAQASVLFETETARRRFTQPVSTDVAAYAFRATDGTPDLVAAIWIPLEDLANVPTPENERRDVDLSVIASGSQGETPVRVDTAVTVVQAVSADRSSPSALRVIVSLRPRPMPEAIIRFVVADGNDDNRGTDIGIRREIPAFPIDAPSVSDLVVASSGSLGPLQRGDIRLSPLPRHTVQVDSTFRLYYEIYGMPDEQAFQTRVRVDRTDREGVAALLDIFRGKRDAQELVFQDHAPAGADVIRFDRTIGGLLIPGTYEVTVAIRLPDGTTITRRTHIRIHEQ